jgi:hypothetical protein
MQSQNKMTTQRKKKKPAKKRAKKRKTPKISFFTIVRQWSLPLFLLLLIGFSLAATFYIIFLHTPSKPLF